MDPKELKSTLKNAREAIRKKEFKEALKSCKAILTDDANHYMALVLIAVAAEGLEQHEQALKAYKRAIAADETQILAWQGLSGFYEKNEAPGHRNDQVDTYLRLVRFHADDKDKQHDVVQKLAKLANENLDQERVNKIVEVCLVAVQEEAGPERKYFLMKKLIPMLQASQIEGKNQQIQKLCEDMFRASVEFDKEVEAVVALYLPILAQERMKELASACLDLYKKYPESSTCLDYHLRCQMDACIGQDAVKVEEDLEDKLSTYESKLEGDTTNTLIAFRGFVAMVKKDWPAAKKHFDEAVDQSTTLVSVYYYQSLVSLRLHQNEAALGFCDKGLKVMNKKSRFVTQSSTDVCGAFQKIKVRALYALGDKRSLSVALETINNDLDTSCEEIRGWLGLVHLKAGNQEEAEACLTGNSVQKLVLEGLLLMKDNKLTEAATRFEKAMDQEPDQSDHFVHLAKCLWTSDSKRAFTLLLKAAKLDPYSSQIFMYLGHYYKELASDLVRSRKCYQKSFDLDPKNDESGEALCDLLKKDGEMEKVHAILTDVTSKATPGSAKWAWLRLGLYQMQHDDPSVAIASLQSALRADAADNHVWECLGEAYLARGSYTAALKAFTKASELCPSNAMYSLFQIASIKQTLGSYTEAVEEYQTILEESPNYVPALKGLGETYLLSAKSLLTKYFHGRARDTCQKSVSSLWRAVSCRPDLSCLWKLMGDACTILHVLPADNFRFEKPDKTVMSKIETLELGGRCYAKALNILPDCSSLWHDLGLNYIYQAKCRPEPEGQGLVEKCVQALKKAIQLDPANHRHWTALGYVAALDCYYKPDLAQHCFIKSVEVEKNNVVAWTNLAALYLKNDNIKLAHEAFKIAQSLEPSYVACWIGQAIIAEVVGHEDAMDLFRHTTELGNHVEGAVGYGHWVCQMLQRREEQDSYVYSYAIEQMTAIPAASDALARYTDRVTSNPVAYNLHGLLLERQKLYQTAARQFERARVLLEKDSADESALLMDVECNYARVLCKQGEYKKCVAVYDKISSHVGGFVDLCQMGLAFFKSGSLELSFQAYTRAAEIAETDQDKSHVLAALAMVCYRHGDLNTAKTTLFQSSQLADPSVSGLKALCALGLMQSDVTLATAAMQELFKHRGGESASCDVLLMMVTLDILQGDLQSAKRQVQRCLHTNPDQPELWCLMSSILLRYFPDHGAAISRTASASLLLGKKTDRKEYLLAAAGDLSHGYHGNPSNNALLSAQRLIHLYPGDVNNWLGLSAAVHEEAVVTPDRDRRLALLAEEYTALKFILEKETISLDQKLWCCKQQVICLVHAGRTGEIIDSLDMLLTNFGSDADVKVFFEVFRHVLQDDADGLADIVQSSSVLYYWQILAEMYLRQGLHAEVMKTLQQSLNTNTAKTAQEMLTTWLKLVSLAYKQILEGTGDASHLRQVFDQGAEQVLSLDPSNMAVGLMQGILNLHGNPRLAKHHIQRILDVHATGSKGHDLSVARRALVYILKKMKKDADIVQDVLESAMMAGDIATLEYHKGLTEDYVNNI